MRRFGLVLGLGLSLLSPLANATSITPRKVKLTLNWKPEPEFGGFYAAQLSGAYGVDALDVEIQPGGAGTPVSQMIAAGQTDFGLVSADDVILARSQGADLVALFSVYQSSPHGILTHAERGFSSLADVFKSPGTLAMQMGLPMTLWLQKQYVQADKPGVKLVPYTGGVSVFLKDQNHSQQGFVTSEALAAQRAGAKVKTFMISESGFDPYVEVLAVSGKFLKEQPTLVASMLKAVQSGWKDYLKNPKPANDLMHKLNPTLDEATFAESAAVQVKFIEGPDAKKLGLGAMTQARWKRLIEQQKELKLLKADIKAEDCFRWQKL